MSQKTSKPTESTASAFDREWMRWHEEHAAEEKIPPGAITAWRYAELMTTPAKQVTQAQAHALLKHQSDLGELRTGMFRVRGKDGYIRSARHWWKP